MTRRLLLINPAHMVDGRRHTGPARYPIPPLNLGYVAALTPDHWEIRIIDEDKRIEDGLDWGPDLVGLTALTPSVPRAYQLAREYRRAGIPVVMGGAHASSVPDEVASHVDTVFIGEAEGTWPQVIRDFERGHMKERYFGEFLPLDGLPHPRRDLFPDHYFVDTMSTSRGCPYSCPFCSVWRFYGRRYRVRPIEDVIAEMATLGSHKLLFFLDDNMTVDHKQVIKLCRAMVERGLKKRYVLQGSLKLADDDELLGWLARSGCRFVFVGLESLDPRTVAEIGKPDLVKVGVDHYAEKIARLHERGIGVFGSFIVGNEEDDLTTFERLRDFILEAEIDCALINILNPNPDTEIWERLSAEGRMLYTDFPHDYAYLAQDNVSFLPTHMSPYQLQQGATYVTRSINRFPTALRRALRTWRHMRRLGPSLLTLAWNWRTLVSLRNYPMRDVREALAPTGASAPESRSGRLPEPAIAKLGGDQALTQS
jgi:radical SAM superfamily enzyme YgiQ (UPF0313 family)